MPLIIEGARQVGKTWLMKEFGKNEYENVAYFYFYENDTLKKIFESDLDANRIIQALKLYSGINIEPEKTLIIFDEIQECPNALSSLKIFSETHNEYHIMSAGSYLGIAYHNDYSFPVGKVDYIDIYPLSFSEYLIAIGEEGIFNIINECDLKLIDTFSDKIIYYLKEYYYVGGMPKVVSTFIETKDYNEVRKVQLTLLRDYRNDFSKHISTSLIPKLEIVWDNIANQLAKENKKFIFGALKKGARASEYESAINSLQKTGMIYKVMKVKNIKLPLMSYAEKEAFKIYMFDVGLLGAKVGLDGKTVIDGNRIFTEYKGALTENYVLNELISNNIITREEYNYNIFYWANDNSTSEVDFITQFRDTIVPIEVKSEINLRAKSFKQFILNYKTKTNIRTSMTNYKKENNMINIPLYLIGILNKYIDL